MVPGLETTRGGAAICVAGGDGSIVARLTVAGALFFDLLLEQPRLVPHLGFSFVFFFGFQVVAQESCRLIGHRRFLYCRT